jgi:uncharacterized protein YggE
LRKNVLDETLVIVGRANGSVVASRSGELALLRSALTRVVSEVNVRLFREPRKLHSLPNSKSSPGIAENDIQTARFSIQPNYTDSRVEPKLSGYSVSNHVNVTVREIGKVGELLDRAVTAGATDVDNLSFLNSDASKALDQAREAAIADARRKAEVYARASAVRLGRVEWITEDTGSGPPVLANKLREASVPIASGEDTVRVRVTVGFQIAR